MTDYSITLPSYSIGEQVYKQIPTVCAPFGATAVVIGGHKAMAAVRERLLTAIQGSAVTITDFVWYGGEASRENIAALAENPAVAAADMIFAVGGGKALDTGKAYGEESGKPVFTFPTIASTCAATTAVSILYHADGTFLAPDFHKAPPVHAFILPSVIAAAPRRYIWAGMGDTYAKYFEAEMSSRGEALVHYHALGVNVSRMCLDPLLTYGAQAMADIDAERCTYAVEQVILAIIVTTGIASILLTAEHIVDYNSGLAHAVFYALTAWPHIEARHLHGEVVGFGVRLVRDLVSPLRQLREGAGETRRELDGLMLALDEQTHAARHIGSHIERVASAAEEFGLAARSSAQTASDLLGVVHRLDGEVAHFRLQG